MTDEQKQAYQDAAKAMALKQINEAAERVARDVARALRMPAGEARYRAPDDMWRHYGTLDRACFREAMLVHLAGLA